MRRKITYDPARDYYTILGVESRASQDQIRQAYRQRVREYHPDLNRDREDWATDQIQLVNEAYDMLRSAARRKEYDRLRWPYVPGISSRAAPCEATGSASIDDADPWWQQAARYQAAYQRAVRTRASGGYAPSYRRTPVQALVGVWRGPYAGRLSILAVALAINIALIVAFIMAPQSTQALIDDLQALLKIKPVLVHPSSLKPEAPTPDRLSRECADPTVQITRLSNYALVGDTLEIYGTVQHPEIWSYTVEIGFLGRSFNGVTAPRVWELIATPSPGQTVPQPFIQDGLLAGPVDFQDRLAGYYAIRLSVRLRNSDIPLLCDMVVQHRQGRPLYNRAS